MVVRINGGWTSYIRELSIGVKKWVVMKLY